MQPQATYQSEKLKKIKTVKTVPKFILYIAYDLKKYTIEVKGAEAKG